MRLTLASAHSDRRHEFCAAQRLHGSAARNGRCEVQPRSMKSVPETPRSGVSGSQKRTGTRSTAFTDETREPHVRRRSATSQYMSAGSARYTISQPSLRHSSFTAATTP